jgi:hypothetical protein
MRAKGFAKTFDALSSVEDEGLVIKNPAGMMNSKWLVKCRKTTKNYTF